MLQKALSALEIADIENLIANGERESRSLEFKRDAVGHRDDDKREWLADISAFANTIGGDLVFGIEETAGVATSLKGIVLPDADAEILRLEHITRTGLEPRLPKIEFRWLPNGASGVLIVRIPRSWAAPHRVTAYKDAKFYARSSAGKHPLDVAELRAAFLNTEAIPERIRKFRQDRIAIIESGDSPLPLREEAKLVVHVLPLSALTEPPNVQIKDMGLFPPIGAFGWSSFHALEGLVTYSGPEAPTNDVRAYTLAFRTGVIEAVAAIGGEGKDRSRWISLGPAERDILSHLKHVFESFQRLEIEPPYFVAVSLTGVRGHAAHIGDRSFSAIVRPVRRDLLSLPELRLEDRPADLHGALRPLFDLLWNGFGFERSYSYDPRGSYVGS
ncbi:MAG: ATP-binding protein [Sinimarinibacterium sp.]|jgi:hypothetical protein